MKTATSLTIPPSAFCTLGIKISFKSDQTRLKEKLSQTELAHFLELYAQAEENPKTTLPKVLAFSESHPDLPILSNLLTYLYIRLRKVRKAHRLIEETYEKHPDYLIAKINYADLLLRRRQFKKIPALFGGIFDLNALYPEKKEFHYSEFRGYVVAMGFYHVAIGARDLALECYRLAVLADPHHSSILALEKKVFPRTLLKKILGILPFCRHWQ
jgi:tetratricopeptide (TPR) repeat protein